MRNVFQYVRKGLFAGVALGALCAFADASVYYVKTGGDDGADGLSWATAKASVAGAVAAVAESGEVGCEIRVAGGVYVHTASITLPTAGVTIRGGYEPATGERDPAANKTVLSGDKNGNDQWKLIDFSATKPDTAFSYTETVYGTCIVEGKLALPEPEELGASKFLMPDSSKGSDNVGGALVVMGGANVLDGLTLIGFNKSADRYGAAINTRNSAVVAGASLMVTNCVFAGMFGDRGVIDLTKVPGALFTDSRFLYNRAGRLVEINSNNNRLEGCEFIGTWKTGDSGGNVIELYSGSGTTVSNCLFTLNFNASQTADHGPNNILGWQSHSGVTFVNNTIRENYTKNNVPLIIFNGGVMRNCLFENNRTQYTTEKAPSIMELCSQADGCTFISNSVYVAVAGTGKTILTAPVVAVGARIPLINCTFVDNRSFVQDADAGNEIIKAGVAVVQSASVSADSCVGLACCTVWQVEDIPVLVSGGIPSSGLWPSKIVSSILRYAGEGTGCAPVVTEDAFPVEILKCSAYGFSTDFVGPIVTTGLVTDDLALEMPTVVDPAHTVPLMRVGARVEGNDDTHRVGTFTYKNNTSFVYDIEDGYEYLLKGAAYVKTTGERIVPDSMDPLPDALGKTRVAGSDQRGAVAAPHPDALTGKTLIVRAKPVGVCTFTGPTTQAVQPGEGSVAVTATAVASGSSFQSWQLEDGTLVSKANPLVLDSLLDDAVVYAVYSAAKVTYTFNLGEAGKFEQNGQNTIAVEFSIGDVPVVPKYTIDETRFYERGWTLPALVGSADAAFALDYVAKLHRIVRYDSAAADGGDGESWATAMNDFGAAIDKAALWTGEVWVKKGIHKPAATASKFFAIASNVAIKGGFAGVEGETDADRDVERNRSVLSGDLKDDDVWSTAAGKTVKVIDPETGDFTPVNPGHADDWWWVTSFGDNVASMFDLTAVACDETAVLDGLWMTGCKNFVLVGADAHPTIKGCTFIGAGRITMQSSFTIDGCKFISCSANDGSTTGCLFGNQTTPSPGILVKDTLFDGIRAGQRGAVTCQSGTLLISFDGCTFTHCYMDPSNKSNQDSQGACIGGTGASATARNCRFVANKVDNFGFIFSGNLVSDSLFLDNVINGSASVYPSTYRAFLEVGDAVRCSFVSNRVTRTGTSTAAVCRQPFVKTTGSLIGCTFDGNEVSVSLDEGCAAEPHAAMVYASGDSARILAHCTFVGNTAPVAVYRHGGVRKVSTYPYTVVNTVFGDSDDTVFEMEATMNRTVYGMHFVGSVIPGFDATADFVASAQNVVSDEMPTFVRKPLVGEYAWGRKLLGCQTGRKAAVPVFQLADGTWCFTDADGTNRKLSDRTVVEPEEPIAKYADPFGEVATKCVPGAVQSYQGLGLVLYLF